MLKQNKSVFITIFFLIFNMFYMFETHNVFGKVKAFEEHNVLGTINVYAEEDADIAVKETVGTTSEGKSIWKLESVTPNYKTVYCLQYEKDSPPSNPVPYKFTTNWYYAGTTLEKILKNVAYYSYPNMSPTDLVSKYNKAGTKFNDEDAIASTQIALWAAQNMYDNGLDFTIEDIDTTYIDKSILEWIKSDSRIYKDVVEGILKDAITDYKNGVIRNPPHLKVEEGNGFSITNNDTDDTVKIGPYKIETNSEIRRDQLKFNIELKSNDDYSYVVNGKGETVTSVNVDDEIYIIAKKENADNIGLNISGKISEEVSYIVAAPMANSSLQTILVYTTIPFEGEDEIYTNIPSENDPKIEKSVNGESEVKLTNKSDKFIYSTNVKISNDVTNYSELTIEDKLEDDLEFVDSEIDVKVDGVSIVKEGALLKGENGPNLIEFKLGQNFDYSKISGKTIVMTIAAKLKEGTSEESLISKYGENKIPNKSVLILNNKRFESNVVKVEIQSEENSKPSIVKSVNGKNDFVLTNKNDQFTYKINAKIPSDVTEYTSLEIKDQLEDSLDIVNSEVDVKVNNTSIKDNGVLEIGTSTPNLVTFKLNENFDYSMVSGKTIEMTIKSKLKDNVSNEDINTKYGESKIPNTSTLLVNGEEYDSNKVKVELPGNDESKPSIVKSVNGESEIKLTNKSDEFTYKINAKIPSDVTGYTSLEIKDQLEDVLQISNSEIDVLVDGTSIKEEGTLDAGTTNPNLVSFKLNENFDYSKVSGKTIEITIKSKLKDDISDDDISTKYGEYKIPNKAVLLINDESYDSNTVKVELPGSDEGEPSIEKSVNGEQEVKLTSKNDEFTYTINAKIPSDITRYSSLEISDQLEDVIDIVNSEVDVTVDDTSIINDGILDMGTTNPNLVSFKLDENFDYSIVSGKTIVMTIVAKLKDEISVEDINSKYGENKIPNKATLLVSDEPYDSNTVKVELPSEEPEISKSVSDNDESLLDKVTLTDNSEVFTYTINYNFGIKTETWQNVYIEDIINDALDIVETPTLKDNDGNDVTTGNWGNNENTVRFDFTKDSESNDYTYLNGKTYTLTIKVKFKDSLTEDLINSYIENNGVTNIANLVVDDKTYPSNEVNVVPAEIEKYPTIYKKINGQDEYVLNEKEEEFAYTISIEIPQNVKKYESFEIKDQLEDDLDIVNSQVDVKIDGNYITSYGRLDKGRESSNLISFKFNEDFDFSTIAGKTITMDIKAKLKDDISYDDIVSKYGENKIPNTGEVLFNDESQKSNTVSVEIPEENDCNGVIGDFVWFDEDKDGIQDDNEKGLKGVTIVLYDKNEEKVSETSSDENGIYYFKNLCEGEYYLQFMIPDEYVPTKMYAGNDDEKDSDIDSRGITKLISLEKDEENLGIDGGFYCLTSDPPEPECETPPETAPKPNENPTLPALGEFPTGFLISGILMFSGVIMTIKRR